MAIIRPSACKQATQLPWQCIGGQCAGAASAPNPRGLGPASPAPASFPALFVRFAAGAPLPVDMCAPCPFQRVKHPSMIIISLPAASTCFSVLLMGTLANSTALAYCSTIVHCAAAQSFVANAFPAHVFFVRALSSSGCGWPSQCRRCIGGSRPTAPLHPYPLVFLNCTWSSAVMAVPTRVAHAGMALRKAA